MYNIDTVYYIQSSWSETREARASQLKYTDVYRVKIVVHMYGKISYVSVKIIKIL